MFVPYVSVSHCAPCVPFHASPRVLLKPIRGDPLKPMRHTSSRLCDRTCNDHRAHMYTDVLLHSMSCGNVVERVWICSSRLNSGLKNGCRSWRRWIHGGIHAGYMPDTCRIHADCVTSARSNGVSVLNPDPRYVLFSISFCAESGQHWVLLGVTTPHYVLPSWEESHRYLPTQTGTVHVVGAQSRSVQTVSLMFHSSTFKNTTKDVPRPTDH